MTRNTPATRAAIRWDWPPEMEAAYQEWADERKNPCLCLTCLQIRLAKVREKLKVTDE